MTSQPPLLTTQPFKKAAPREERQQRLSVKALCVPFASRLSTLLFFGSAAAALAIGWRLREESYLIAENGLGYGLGIVGGTLMVLLLLYPLRKRARFMRHAGPVKWWFRSHMTFGVVGPVAILYHANFQLGSINSNVALFCMLLVAGSGLVGRYIYSKIHYGLYGRKASLKELRQASTLIKALIEKETEADDGVKSRIDRLEARVMAPPSGVLQSGARLFGLALQILWCRLMLRSELHHSVGQLAARHGWSENQRRIVLDKARRDLSDYLTIMAKIGHLAVYERLFALWHLLHFPLFLMMVVSGLVHVVAVHVY